MLKFYLAFVVLIQAAYGINGRCRALVLGGGSDRGAFQAGAISGLATYLPPGEATWDLVLGNGVGAFNAFFVAQTSINQESTLNYTLSNFWLNFKRSQFYHPWFGGRLVGYFLKTGLYNDAPLKATIKSKFTGAFNRFLLVGVTDLHESKYYMLNSSQPTENLLLSIQASLNTHGNFPITNFGKYQFASGEIIFGVDLASAVYYCQGLGYRNSHITVDIAMVTNAKLKPFDPTGKNVLEMTQRYTEIVNYHNVFERIINAKGNFPGVLFRTQITMNDNILMKSTYPFSYESPKHLKTEFNEGILAAKSALGVK